MNKLKARAGPVLALVALIWGIELLNWLTGHRLNSLGIEPRSFGGLIGIVTAPLLHAGFGHALSNTFPLLAFGYLLALRSEERFIRVCVAVTVLGGGAVWLLGRSVLHVGASGLVFGLFGYLIACAWFERSPPAIASAALVAIAYGGLVWGLVPAAGISVESHLFGLLAGIAVARMDGHSRTAI